jgi:hypothetical protein
MSFSPNNSISPYIPTSTYLPQDPEQFRIKFSELYRQLGYAVNIREIAIYDPVEFLTGQQWFDPNNNQNKRQTFRKVFPITDASLIFNHNISNITNITHYYGTGFDSGTGLHYPIPYVDVTNVANQISISVSATQIIITKGAFAPPAITSGFLILEYLNS